jgi:serine/threonine protein kinase
LNELAIKEKAKKRLKQINDYEVIEKIGNGSFGEVLKVSNSKGVFALKILDKGDLENL